MADRLGLKIQDLVNQQHPLYRKRFEPQNLSEADWIIVIRQNPELLKQPIALRGDVTILVETPSDIIKI